MGSRSSILETTIAFAGNLISERSDKARGVTVKPSVLAIRASRELLKALPSLWPT